jgi:hypothetical protein
MYYSNKNYKYYKYILNKSFRIKDLTYYKASKFYVFTC